jgi:hypothetical protein
MRCAPTSLSLFLFSLFCFDIPYDRFLAAPLLFFQQHPSCLHLTGWILRSVCFSNSSCLSQPGQVPDQAPHPLARLLSTLGRALVSTLPVCYLAKASKKTVLHYAMRFPRVMKSSTPGFHVKQPRIPMGFLHSYCLSPMPVSASTSQLPR